MAKMAIAAMVMLALSGGAAFAQLDQEETGFYADPVMADPSPVPVHVFAATIATQDVAAVAPAANYVAPSDAKVARMAKDSKSASTACTALNPCAVFTPAARG